MKIILKKERPISWNKYMHLHWAVKEQEVLRIHELVKVAIVLAKFSLIQTPVDIIMTAYFRNRPLDCSNICAKLYEDGLKGSVIVDDNIKYVRSMKTVSLIDKDNPRLVIQIDTV